MEQLNVLMNDNGKFDLSQDNAGYIEEYCAKLMKIELNDFFKGSIFSYYTISFDVCGFGKKIMTENIYKVDGEIEGQAYYDNGYLYCPLFDYITAAPYVNIQLDGYETDAQGDIISIYKSSIFTLRFSPSITGDSYYPSTVRTDLKLTERINEAIENKFEVYKVSENELSDNAVNTNKLKDYAVTNVKLSDAAVNERVLADSSVTSSKLSDDCVKNEHISDAEISLSKLSQNAINDFLEIIRNDDLIEANTNWQPFYNSVKDVFRTFFDDFNQQTIDIVEDFFLDCDNAVADGDAYTYCYYAWYIFVAIYSLLDEVGTNEMLNENYVRIDNFNDTINGINSAIADISDVYATKSALNAIISEINTAIAAVAGGENNE